ncbi:MAG: hypothetical protein ABI192_08140 [Bradyrhizobium sp.]
MTISSISAPPPVQPTYTASQTTPPVVNNDNDNDDAGAAQPPTPAPLPPGQGTRIDQLV